MPAATTTKALPIVSNTPVEEHWYRPSLRGVLLACLILVLYWNVIPDLISDWWEVPGASQGFLLPPLALYIAWLRRRSTLAYPASPDNRGLLVIALACLLFLVGKVGAEFFLMRLSLVVLLTGCIGTFWGALRLRTLLFPLVLLVTMIPLPVVVYNSLSAPLQLFSSDVATRLAQAFGVAIYRDGNIIQLAQTSLGVAEACSGLESLSSLMVAALLLGPLQNLRILARVVLFGLSIPLAIAVNVMRVTGTALLADYRPEWAMGFYHSFSGWLVFVAGFGILWISAKALHAWFNRS